MEKYFGTAQIKENTWKEGNSSSYDSSFNFETLYSGMRPALLDFKMYMNYFVNTKETKFQNKIYVK